MRPDVHAAALRSAAKLVFGMASLSLVACTADPTEESSASDNALTNSKGDANGSTNNGNTGDNGNGETNPTNEPTTPECKATLASAFPQPSGYEWKPVPQSPDVVACCDQELTKHDAMTKYRWDCCVAYDPATVPAGQKPKGIGFSDGHGMACTPWGPPVPPSMNRMKRRLAQRINQLVA
jgi:hypothetical protein